MILLFPDLDTLRLALTSSIVGPDVTLAPAAVSFDEQGRIYVEPSVALSKPTAKNLDRIGVKGSKRHGSETPEEVTSWLQILPVTKETGTPELSSQAPVLFDLTSADDLPTLVTEMFRLGNDRQSFRWFATPDDRDGKHVLLRVIGPPYYTLLRALDRTASGTVGEVRAYTERAPRVWVEIGHNHPLAAQVRAPEGQLVLIRAPRAWLFLDEAPYQDVYDILQFQLPAAPVGWSETTAPQKLTVPLRLTAGNAADVPELWVLRDDAIARLDTFVRDADDRLIQRLMFAVAADPQGKRAVILRTRPSKLAPPALALEGALGFKPFWKLPNLYLPAGKRLHPTLRRDAVRRLLADDPDQVVWLYPDDRGGFTPETIPDSAFRSLEDWVDYVIETDRAPLAAWIESTRFDFDHFICTETGGPKTGPGKGEREPKIKDGDEGKPTKPATPKTGGKGKSAPRSAAPSEFLPPAPDVKPPNEWRIRRESLEEQFLAADGSLDNPERQALWPELAVTNAGEGSRSEAAVCWLNALWESDPLPPDWLGQWVRAEFPGAGESIRAEDFDKRLDNATPSVEDHRAVVAGFLWLAAQKPVPGWLTSRLPAIQKYLEAHERELPVRGVWLAGYRLTQLTGHDVLGLARVRDRLLQRLLDEGLKAERDLPLFLRYAGQKDSGRLRLVRDKALELHRVVRKWTQHIPLNLPYVDLMFAFALAKLGESTAAKRLVEDARKVMEYPIEGKWTDIRQENEAIRTIASNTLFKEFRYQIDEAIAGRAHRGLSQELLDELDALRKKGRSPEFFIQGPSQRNNPFSGATYDIDRLREQSRILEPHGTQDPYLATGHRTDSLAKITSEVQGIREPKRWANEVDRHIRATPHDYPPAFFRIRFLQYAVSEAPRRQGEEYTAKLLSDVLITLQQETKPSTGETSWPDTAEQLGKLLERALFMAAHFDRRDLTQQLVSRFIELVLSRPETDRYRLVNVVARECFKSLRKLGLRDEIGRLLTQVQTMLLKGENLSDLRKTSTGHSPKLWSSVLQTLLNLATGWQILGQTDKATPILDAARAELLSPQCAASPGQEYADLVRAYVRATSHGSSEVGLARIVELLQQIDRARITNSFTTSRSYSRFHLNIVEEVVSALVSDEFALGPAGRKWLDDDEYLVRKRVHADMKRERERSGL